MNAVILAVAALVSLNGEWKLDYFLQPNEGAVRTVPLAVPHRTVKATVPGNCELDLARAGVLPPAEIGLNIRRYLPYEEYQWLYTRTFTAPACDAKGGERAVLRFEGIDTLADVFLNGEKIGETENMLIPHEFDVTGRLKPGENTVQVLIRSVTVEGQDTTVGELGYFMDFGDSQPFRKAAHMYGWDILPRLCVAGLWRGVSLEVRPAWRIDDVAWITQTDFDCRQRCGTVQAQFRVHAPRGAFHAGNTFKVSLNENGRTVSYGDGPLVAAHSRKGIYLRNAKMWWPRGMGEPSLYDARVEVLSPEGTVLAKHEIRFGVRVIGLERDDVYGPERPGQFLFRVNGEPCYIRGSNWVPLDAFHARDGEHLIPTLDLFVDLNCNMVRVWGGGVYEPDAFYDYCDRNGLMVWQDFMTGCSVFPQDDRYAKLTEQEIKSVVMRLRNHPSMALWSGNNENDDAFGWRNPNWRIDPNRDRNSRQTIPNVLMEYDRSLSYLPSSPYASPDVFAGKAQPSEQHLWGPRDFYKTPFYTNSPAWFASEMGYHGCPARSTLERMMTRDCVYPWTKITGDDPKKDFHWNDEWMIKAVSPHLERTGWIGDRNNLMTKQVKLMFGSVPHDLDLFIEQSQTIQAEALKTFCEMFRARKFTRFNGMIWWNVRDGWPVLSDAVVDYYYTKKKGYYAIRKAQQDQIVCVTDDHGVWAVNDALRPVRGHAKLTDVVRGTQLMDVDFTIPANGKVRLGDVPFSGQGMIRIAATLDGRSYASHFLYGDPPFDWTDYRKWLTAAETGEQGRLVP